MITNKRHNQIIEHKDKTINDYLAKIIKLEKELEQAKNLKDILGKFSGISINGQGIAYTGGSWNIEASFGDNVAQYVEDMFGGKKVIKQEANKGIKIDKHGNVTTGLTKQNVDKGYSYKLVRE